MGQHYLCGRRPATDGGERVLTEKGIPTWPPRQCCSYVAINGQDAHWPPQPRWLCYNFRSASLHHQVGSTSSRMRSSIVWRLRMSANLSPRTSASAGKGREL